MPVVVSEKSSWSVRWRAALWLPLVAAFLLAPAPALAQTPMPPPVATVMGDLNPRNTNIQFTLTAQTAPTGYTTNYQAQTRILGATSWSDDDITTETTNDFTGRNTRLTGVAAGTRFEIRFRYRYVEDDPPNTVIDGPWSTEQSVTTGNKDNFVPFRVGSGNGVDGRTNFRATALSSSSLRLSWVYPDSRGSVIEDYSLRYRATTNCSETTGWTEVTVAGTEVSHTLTRLDASTAYGVQIRPRNANGMPTWSQTCARATTQAPPATAPDAPDAPTLVAGDTQLTVSWTAPASDGGSAITDYDVRWRTASSAPSGNWSEPASDATSTDLTATIASLVNGTEYQVQVRAQNAIGEGLWSAAATGTPATTPGAPAAPTLTPGDTELTGSWTAPAVTGGSAITSYEVQWKVASAADSTYGDTGVALGTFPATTVTITSLTNGSAYDVRVRAVNARGGGAWSAAATETPVAPATAPAAPAAPTLTVRDTALGVSWTAPNDGGSAITDYDVRWRELQDPPSGNWSEPASDATSTATTATISSLDNGTAYEVQVRAQNAIGEGMFSASAMATPATTPAAPTALTLTVGNARLTGSWTAPLNNGGSAITGYEAQWKVASAQDDTYGSTNTTVTGTDLTITMLTNGTEYAVRVRAVNAQGNSDWSAVAMQTPATTPGVPTSLMLTPANEQLTGSWSAPTATGGSAITGYEVQWKVASAQDNTYGSTNTTVVGTGVTITSLTNGTAYAVQVRAVNARGNSAWSTAVMATPATTPGAPTSPTAMAGTGAAGKETLMVSWTAPISTGGAAITSYDVQYQLGNSGAETIITGITGLTHTIPSLTKNMQYRARVRAVNARGAGGWSGYTSLVRVLGVPEAPTLPTAMAGAGTDDKETLTVGWTAPSNNGGSAITSYEVQYRIDGESPSTATQSDPSMRSLKISSLTKNKEYQAQVRAVNAQGAGAWTAYTPLRRVLGAPDAPAINTLTAGNAQLTVAWTAPSETGGTDVLTYSIEWKLASAGAYDGQANQGASARSYTIGSLMNGESYNVRVKARNAQGTSAPSAEQTATPATTPGVPTGISLTVGNAQLMVGWSAPATGGSPITDYDVQWRELMNPPSGNWTALADTSPSTALTATITGLDNGTAYEVQVLAQNARGTSDWSASATETPATTPAAPAAPSVSAGSGIAGAGMLTISWTAPTMTGGSPITSYVVEYQVGTTGTTTSRSNISGTSLTIESLTKDTEYRARVRAVNARGMSDWSSYSSLARVLGVPDAPAAPTVRRGAEALNVSWAAPSNTGGSPITAYKVEWKEADDAAYGDPMEIAAGTTTARITGLTNDTEYDVRVIAVNGQGDSAASDAAQGMPTDAPTISFGAGTYTIAEEAASPLTLTVTLSEAPDAALSLSYTITGTAAGSETYSLTPASGSLTFASGETSAEMTLTPFNDAFVALDREFTIALNIPEDYSPGVNDSTIVTITDDEAPDARIAIGTDAASTMAYAPSVAEGTGDFMVPVTINTAPLTAISIALIDTPVPAARTFDYTSGPYTVTFAAKTTNLTAMVNIPIADDSMPEGDEAFTIALAAATNPADDAGDAYARNAQSSTGTITITDNEPGAPTGLTLTIQDAALDASWAAPTETGGGNINGYDVEYKLSSAGDNAWGSANVGTVNVSARTATISSLQNGMRYDVRVRAKTDLSSGGEWSAVERQAPIGPPAAPTSFTLTAGNKMLTGSWTAPTMTGGAPITDYEVQWKVASANDNTYGSTNTAVVGTGVTISSLTNGTEYAVRVRAQNSEGPGAWSTVVMETPAAVPDAPTALSLTEGNEQLDVSWSEPADTGGSAITAYEVQWKVASAADNTYGSANVGTINLNARTTTISSLTNDVAYAVRVRATNTVGTSPWSDPATETPATTPAVPVVTLQPGDGQLTVTWQAPADNGRVIDGYVVQYKLTDDASWTDAGHSGILTSLTISSLMNEMEYDVRVRASNEIGTGDWSTVAQATPLEAPAPVVPAAPSVVVDDEGDAGTLDVSWVAPATHPRAPIMDYDLRYKLTSAADEPANWRNVPFTGTGTSAEITGLQDSQPYDVQVRASNPYPNDDNPLNAEFPVAVSAPGNWSASGMATTLTPTAPDAPAAPTVDMSSREGMLLVSWSAPALGTGNLPITGYEVQWKLTSAADADYSSANVQQRGTETSATISGLDMNSMSYDVRVRARNRVVDVVGASAWSASGSGTSLMPIAPSAPSAPTLSSNTSGTLNVSWRAPADGGSAIMRYEVQYRLAPPATSAWTSENVRISGLSATITALEEGQDYQVRVRAINRIGDGAWSRLATGAPSSAQRNARTASSSLSQTGSVLSSGVVDVLGEHLVTPPPATPAAPPPTIAPTPPPLTDADTSTGSSAPAPSPAAPAPDSDERSNFALDRLALGGGSLLPMARTPAPPNPKLYRVRTHADETESVRTLGMRDILNQGAFRLSLNGRDGDKAADGARSSWAVWGRGNARGFSSNPSGLSSLEGNAYSGWLGLDYNYRNFLGGLAVSYDETITNYRTNEGNSGTITTRLGSIYPYARYAALGRKVQFWALAGLGGGTLELEEGGSSLTTDVDTQLLAFGIKGDVLRLYGADLAIKSDASFSRFATESVTNLPSVTTEPQRLRAALEARYPIELDRVHQFTPSLELGGRLDLNNAVSGAGLEMSGGVLYSNRSLRLDVDLRARGLLAHRADAEEWGVSFLARLQPDQFGFGWFASIIPSWGRTQSGAARLWDEPIQEWQNSPIQDVSWQPDRLDAELGYAFGLRSTPAIVSPFTKIGTTRLGAQSLALGARFDLPAQPLRLELLGERLAAPSAAEAEHRIGLQLRMNF